jgi:restriction endonuclease Mrr
MTPKNQSIFHVMASAAMPSMGQGRSSHVAAFVPSRLNLALQLQHANKGIFLATSRFTEDARAYVAQIGSKIVLIDGAQLADLMIDHDVGVSTVSLYPVKKIDSDYFNEGI